MKAILNNTAPAMREEDFMHVVKNFSETGVSEKEIIAALSEINATVNIQDVLKQKTRNGGFIARPSNN